MVACVAASPPSWETLFIGGILGAASASHVFCDTLDTGPTRQTLSDVCEYPKRKGHAPGGIHSATRRFGMRTGHQVVGGGVLLGDSLLFMKGRKAASRLLGTV